MKSYFIRLTIQVIKWVLSNKKIEKKKQPKPLKKNDGKQSQPDRWTQDSLISTKQAPTEPLKGWWLLDGEIYFPCLTTRPSLQSGHLHTITKGPLVILREDGWLGHKYQWSMSVRTAACPSTCRRIYHPNRHRLFHVGLLPMFPWTLSKGACLY